MRHLSNKEKKELINNLPKGYEISKKDEIKENNGIILKDNIPYLIIIDNKYLPHLKSIPEENYSSVYVDKGAIPFIAKGADLMKPGIREIEQQIKKNDIIMIKDENAKKTIALGFSLYNFEEMQQQEKGKSIIIYHYIGDQYY